MNNTKKILIGFALGITACLLMAALPTTLNTNQFNAGGPLSIANGYITTNAVVKTAVTATNTTSTVPFFNLNNNNSGVSWIYWNFNGTENWYVGGYPAVFSIGNQNTDVIQIEAATLKVIFPNLVEFRNLGITNNAMYYGTGMLTNTATAWLSGITNSASYYGTGILTNQNDIRIGVAGKGLQIAEGSNAKMGTNSLNGTTAVTINTTAVTASSRIFLTIQSPVGTVASPYVSARTPGTSFQVKSTGASDTSVFAWLIVEP